MYPPDEQLRFNVGARWFATFRAAMKYAKWKPTVIHRFPGDQWVMLTSQGIVIEDRKERK
jgi:hypothetical protein